VIVISEKNRIDRKRSGAADLDENRRAEQQRDEHDARGDERR
jgi:hypothetical protein